LIARVSTLTKNFSTHLIDVSSIGVRLHGENLPLPGEDVLVSVEGVKGFGTIVWQKGDTRGVAFEPSLFPSEVQKLRQLVSQAQGLSPDLKAAWDDWELGMAR
jgi:hypothetical protein